MCKWTKLYLNIQSVDRGFMWLNKLRVDLFAHIFFLANPHYFFEKVNPHGKLNIPVILPLI